MEAVWPGTLRGRVVDWIADDPDPGTREELSDLLEAADAADPAAVDDLADRFRMDLEFGTAGLRGALGGGPNRMNLAVVIRAAAGIAAWLADTAGPDGPRRGVAVCFDARHRSADFAEATAAVLAAAGIDAHLLPGPLPTPVLAFAVRHLGAAAGVMVTASHNPPQDNGYKVYDGTGRQIVAPTDTLIAAAMAAVPLVSAVPRSGPDDPDIRRLGDGVVAAYVSGAGAVGRVPAGRTVTAAYTAMHGVGAGTFRRAFAAAGFPPAVEVPAQVEPDPDFPTVAFPNPEEPGALDLGLATASAAGAAVLLANDPDADRLGAAVPDPARGPASLPEGWRVLRGDEIGAVLAQHLLANGGLAPNAVLATTIVSSTLLSKMAAAAGVVYVETLTGFKWISRAAGPGQTLGFGYEEALGFCVGDLVGDKDGITAAVVFAEAVACLAAEGRTVLDVLDDLARAHGVHLTGQWSVRVAGAEGMAEMAAAMAQLRAAPPTELVGRPVTSVTDLLRGDGGCLAPSDVLVLYLDGARIVVRPSGTEPKLKCYVEVVEPVDPGAADGLAGARTRAADALSALTTAIATATGLG
ncbi:MAG: Phosphomannomutase [Acidimicrobiales bacterium]|nr:Phosphomannomutase [Acidimicrobiales bacterium]